MATLGCQEILLLAHKLLSVPSGAAAELFPTIHLLWSIGLLEGTSSDMTDFEGRIFTQLCTIITDKSDAAMLYHYMLLRGSQDREDFKFGRDSWRSMNDQWIVGEDTRGGAELAIADWIDRIPHVIKCQTGVEIFPGIFSDIIVHIKIDGIVWMIPVEVNGPSHYVFRMPSAIPELDLKTIRRNEIILRSIGLGPHAIRIARNVLNISYIDYNKLVSLGDAERVDVLLDMIRNSV